jgi:hypothetical protein
MSIAWERLTYHHNLKSGCAVPRCMASFLACAIFGEGRAARETLAILLSPAIPTGKSLLYEMVRIGRLIEGLLYSGSRSRSNYSCQNPREVRTVVHDGSSGTSACEASCPGVCRCSGAFPKDDAWVLALRSFQDTGRAGRTASVYF